MDVLASGGGDAGLGAIHPPAEERPRSEPREPKEQGESSVSVHRLRGAIDGACQVFFLGWRMKHAADLAGLTEDEQWGRFILTRLASDFDEHPEDYALAGLLEAGLAEATGNESRDQMSLRIAKQQNEADRNYVAVAVRAGACRAEVLDGMPRVS